MELGDFDYVLVGTGLTESILSAALALAGKKVLHVDEKNHYGDFEATLTPATMPVEQFEAAECSKSVKWDQEIEPDRSAERQFNVDLTPMLMLCRGEMVDALVRSGVSRYLEFKTLEDALMLDNDDSLIRVPCSKAAVFKSKELSMGEKRQLMRFLQYSMDSSTIAQAGGSKDAVKYRNEANLNQGRSLARPQNKSTDSIGYEHGEGQSFESFLTENCKLSPKLKNSIMYAVGLLPEVCQDLSVERGMESVQRYLNGLGRFGGTAFLCPVYGVSEIGQAFCRLSSVHGSIFMLNRKLKSYDESEGVAIIQDLDSGEDLTIKTKHVISNDKTEKKVETTQVMVHKACISNGPLVSLASYDGEPSVESLYKASAVGGHPISKRNFPEFARAFMVIPPNHDSIKNKCTIYVLQLDHGVAASAPGYFVIHFFCESTDVENSDEQKDSVRLAAENVFKRAKQNLERKLRVKLGANTKQANDEVALEEKKSSEPELEISWDFTHVRRKQVVAPTSTKTQTYVPDVEIGLSMHRYVELAKEIFNSLEPSETFLPSEEETKRNPGMMEEDPTAFVERIKVPQPVDLTWFKFLDGKEL